MRPLGRLRWQLTLSHLVAIAVTLVLMIAAVLVLGSAASGWWSANPKTEPAQDARLVADAVGGVAASGDAAQLNATLRELATGQLRLGGGAPSYGPPAWTNQPPTLQNVSYIVVLDSSGRPIASSDLSGAAFSPSEQAEWRPLADQALAGPVAGRAVAGHTDAAALVTIRQGPGPAALGAAPLPGANGRPASVVLVAVSSLPAAGRTWGFVRALAVFAAASVAVLGAAFLFALLSSSVVAYLLSRRLVRRLERLGGAVEALARGNLSSRVDEGRNDEVGQLARRINLMAGDLQRSMAEVQAERDRVFGLLEARQQLVAGVSHELRTPVTTVRGYLESALARNGAVPQALRADLETMSHEVERLQGLIEDLFTLSRAEVGRLVLRAEPTDVAAIVRRVAATAAPLAWDQRRVEVVVDLPPGLPLARADAQRVEQMLSNLLTNAVQHTPPGGLVAVAASAAPDAVTIEVRDTGEGIAASDLPHVFERFYRGSNGDGRGAGLGLALVAELAQAMAGSVEVASVAGEGSRFSVRLPLA